MANGVEVLGSFDSAAGANTNVLPVDHTPTEYFLQGQQHRFLEKQFEYQKQQQQIADLVKATNFDTKDVNPNDRPTIEKKIKDVMDYVYQNPNALSPDPQNPEAMKKYNTQQQLWQETHNLIDKSKTDFETAKHLQDMIAANPELQNQLPKVNEFLNGDLEKRQWTGFDPIAPSFNPITVLGGWKDFREQQKTTGNAQYAGGGYNKFTTTTTNTPESADQYLNLLWENPQTGAQDEVNYQWSKDPSLAQNFASKKDYFIKAWKPALLKSGAGTEDEVKGVNYAPASQLPNGGKPIDSWVVDYGRDLYTPNSSAYTGKRVIGGKEYDFAPAQAGMYVKAPTQLFKNADGQPNSTSITVVGGFIKDPDSGKIFAVPSNDPTGMFPIDNYNSQVISPSLSQKYAGQTYNYEQDVQNYAIQSGNADLLKVPKQGGGVEQPKQEDNSYVAPDGNSYTMDELKSKFGYTDEQIQQAIDLGNLKEQ